MPIYDFDLEIQEVFKENFSKIPHMDWKKWLDITSREDYEAISLKLSGVEAVDDLYTKIKTKKTTSKQLSVRLEDLIKDQDSVRDFIMCHSSGTSGGHIKDLKWIYMAELIIRKIWAPGMQAIFESSGLRKNSAAVVFVPSRLQNDGLRFIENYRVVQLYSAEFSQRLVLSIIKPDSYIIDQYKNAFSLSTVAKILSLDSISVVSAPAIIILKWADLSRFRDALNDSVTKESEESDPNLEDLRKRIDRLGIEGAAEEIQTNLSQKLSQATIIFSISSFTEKDWVKIRSFMHWEEGSERFTNLYVGSEFGPFAATIRRSPDEISPKNQMCVFPLTIPVLENNGKRELISRFKPKIGRLLISRVNLENPVINIDIGDIITVENQKGLPIIGGTILRDGFSLKTKIEFASEIKMPENPSIMVGDYFRLKNNEFIDPRRLLTCLAERSDYERKPAILLGTEKNGDSWTLFISIKTERENIILENILKNLSSCPNGVKIEEEIRKGNLNIKIVDYELINFEKVRVELFQGVQQGYYPKGVLKKWPLYVIRPNF